MAVAVAAAAIDPVAVAEVYFECTRFVVGLPEVGMSVGEHKVAVG